jgi:glycosyltransferase involved in cell wall biosynthesis
MPPCVVIPNGVDTAHFSRPTDYPEDPNSLVFTATMNYGPNAEAALFFVRAIWPLIRAQLPEANLKIVGHGPPPEVWQLNNESGITVTGTVPEVRPYLASAQVVIVPLRVGGGTRLKIVEALSMERAVVTTSLGCEGLGAEDGRHLVVANEPAEFARRVVTLLREPARRAALGRAGRQFVQERYDWRAIGGDLRAALVRLSGPGYTSEQPPSTRQGSSKHASPRWGVGGQP